VLTVALHPELVIAVAEVRDGSMRLAEDADRVRANRARLARAAGFTPERTAHVRITYGRDDYRRYREVTAAGPDDHTIAARFPDDAAEPVDALATRASGVGLLLPVADCMPVVLLDPVVRVVMLTHLGRHSVEQRGGATSVRWLAERFGADPGNILAWLGPAPNGAAYPLHALGDRAFADVVPEQLREAGVRSEHLRPSGWDTVTDPRFFSHSEFLAGRQPTDGRHAVVAGLRAPAAG
jgi:copper oxidase (laccase) domain-containing protein